MGLLKGSKKGGKEEPSPAASPSGAAAVAAPKAGAGGSEKKVSQPVADSSPNAKPKASTLANAAHADALKMQQIAKLKILLEQKLVSHSTLSKQLVEKKSVS